MIIATTKAIRPSSSAAAKPMKSRPCWPSAAAGLRIALFRNWPKTMPTPMAATPTPIAARPAPITLADARSMRFSFVKRLKSLVKVDCIVDVERGQQGEHIGLDRADQQLQRHHADDEDEAQYADRRAGETARAQAADDEIAEHLDEDVAGDHRHEQSQREAERTHHEGEQLDHEDERQEHLGRAVGDEEREEMELVPPEADDQHDREADDRHYAGD